MALQHGRGCSSQKRKNFTIKWVKPPAVPARRSPRQSAGQPANKPYKQPGAQKYFMHVKEVHLKQQKGSKRLMKLPQEFFPVQDVTPALSAAAATKLDGMTEGHRAMMLYKSLRSAIMPPPTIVPIPPPVVPPVAPPVVPAMQPPRHHHSGPDNDGDTAERGQENQHYSDKAGGRKSIPLKRSPEPQGRPYVTPALSAAATTKLDGMTEGHRAMMLYKSLRAIMPPPTIAPIPPPVVPPVAPPVVPAVQPPRHHHSGPGYDGVTDFNPNAYTVGGGQATTTRQRKRVRHNTMADLGGWRLAATEQGFSEYPPEHPPVPEHPVPHSYKI